MERFETFTVLISEIARVIRKIKTEEMAKWGLKSNHVSCVYYLYKKKTLTLTQLCEVCNEDKANVSRSVEYLESIGILTVKQGKGRMYKNPYVLTDQGMEIGESLNKRVEEILRRVSNGVSEENRAIMYQSLREINKNLTDVYNEYV